MWRRGDVVYAVVVLTALVLETVALIGLSLAFFFRRLDLLSTTRASGALAISVGVTALVLVALAIYTLGYHHASDLIARRISSQIAAWTERWTKVVLLGEVAPAPPFPRAAEEALIGLREVLTGAEGDQVSGLLRGSGVEAKLIKRLGSFRISRRLDSLEALARCRLPAALPEILPLLREKEDVERVMAARAAAHTLAGMPEGEGRTLAAREFAQALRDAQVAPGVLAEALLLVEDAAAEVIHQLFEPPVARNVVRRSALDAVGRLGLLQLAPLCAAQLEDPDAEVRAASLRAMGRLGEVPDSARQTVIAAIDDPIDFVRVQATRTVGRLHGNDVLPTLWRRLGDASWWVRRAAAEALLERGDEGEAELIRAIDAHPDRYGRELAKQVFADRAALRERHKAQAGMRA